jgi:hypothetical protein
MIDLDPAVVGLGAGAVIVIGAKVVDTAVTLAERIKNGSHSTAPNEQQAEKQSAPSPSRRNAGQ